jgi:hypothetical protein
MRPVGVTTSLRFDWSLVDRLPPAIRGSQLRVVPPLDEKRYEDRFSLPNGLLSTARRKVGRHVVGLEADEAPVGVAVFAPALPRTYPIRVADVRFAPALLLGLHALAERDYTLVAIDDDPTLEGWLVGRGATVYMRLVRYRGDPRRA